MKDATLEWWLDNCYEVQTALARRCSKLNIPAHPVHPQTPANVNSLSDKVIQAYHHTIDRLTTHLSQEVVDALNRRFYDLSLPLPYDITKIDQLIGQTDPFFSKICIPLPKTVEEINELTDNQFLWVYITCYNGYWESFSFELQSAFNECLESKANKWMRFSLDKLTAENVRATSENTIECLSAQLEGNLIKWAKLPREVQTALNERLKTPITLDRVNTDKLSTTNANTYHTFFTKYPNDWKGLSRAKQQAFNAAFAEEELTQLAVKWWWS